MTFPDDNNDLTTADLILRQAKVLDRIDDETHYVEAMSSQRDEHHPTRGRVLDATDSPEIFVGNGDTWVDVTTDTGLSTPAVITERVGNIAFLNEYATAGTGTEDDPWIVDPNDPLSKLSNYESGLGTLYAPAGLYRITDSIRPQDYAVRRQNDPALSGVDEIYAMPSVVGAGLHSTTIILDDGVDKSLYDLNIDSESVIPDNETAIGGSLRNMTLIGNKANNSSGHGIYTNKSGSRLLFHTKFENLYIRRTAEDGIRFSDGNFPQFSNITINRPDKAGVHAYGGDAYFHNVNVNHCQTMGWVIDGIENWFSNIYSGTAEGIGIRVNDGPNLFSNIGLRGNVVSSGDNMQMYLNSTADDVIINGGWVDCASRTDYGVSAAGVDIRLSDVTVRNFNSTPYNVTGTRVSVHDTIEMSGAPDAANYDSEDAGTTIIDISSTTPHDRYDVLQDGTLDGPY